MMLEIKIEIKRAKVTEAKVKEKAKTIRAEVKGNQIKVKGKEKIATGKGAGFKEEDKMRSGMATEIKNAEKEKVEERKMAAGVGAGQSQAGQKPIGARRKPKSK